MKLDKEEVRRPDAFLQLSDKASHWLGKNRQIVLIVVAILVVSGIGYGAYDLYRANRETKAQEALYEARKKFDPSLSNPAQPPAEKPAAKLTDESVMAFNRVMSEYKGTQASKVAAIELSQAFLDEKKKEEALNVFNQVSSSSSHDIVNSLLTLQNAKVLEVNGKCADAVTLLEKVWNSKKTLKTLQTEARLRAGICYEQMSQIEKAKEMFTLASQDQGAAADTAKKYLRLLQPNAG